MISFHHIIGTILIIVMFTLLQVADSSKNSVGPSSKTKTKPTSGRIELKPSINFDDLQLRVLCETDEWIAQFRAVRSIWTKCLGLQKVFLPTEWPHLRPSTYQLLQYMMQAGDESMNPFCRLASNWKVCAHHLRPVTCLVSDFDVIQRAKDPKYTPLRRSRQSTGAYSPARFAAITSRYAKDEDDIEHQAALFTIHCEAIRLSAHYRAHSSGSMKDGILSAMQFEQDDWHDFDDEDELMSRRSTMGAKAKIEL